MTQVLRLGAIALVLLAAGLLAACEDDGDGGDSPTATSEATEPGGATPDGGETPDDAEEPTEADSGSGSFDDVPVPDGSTESGSGTFTADEIPFVDPGGNVDPGAFSNIEWRTYDTDMDSAAVLDFYDTALNDWDEVFKLDSGPGAFGIWTRNNNDEVLWVGTTNIGEGTELLLIHATAD